MNMDGDEVRRRRLALGLTQAALAMAAGIKQPQLSRIERGLLEPARWYWVRIGKALQSAEIGAKHGPAP